MIQVKNISKSFSGVEILKDISFVFEKGKTNLIIGKSGSGKSVLTKCIVGLLEPFSLFKKIKKVSSDRLMEERIRVPNTKKILITFKSMFQNQFNWI